MASLSNIFLANPITQINSNSNFLVVGNKFYYNYASTSKFRKSFNGVFACSRWTPFVRKVGAQSRDRNVSVLSFKNPSSAGSVSDESKSNSSKALSIMLPFVVAATAIAALTNPSTFAWVSKDYYPPALGGIMFSIGIGMSIDDFALACKRPLPLSVGFMAQYVIKPMLGVLIARSFGLPSMFNAGFILNSCVSSALLSTFASFLSKGDVALSILLTSSSTLLSVIIIPLLTGMLFGSVVPIDAVAMSKSILQVVMVPVALGLVLNTYAKSAVSIIRRAMPFVGMVCTSLCIGSPLALNRNQILTPEGLQLVLPMLMFHFMVFTVGYWVSKIPFLRQEERVCRTISLCTGMPNSTLAGMLASQFLGSSHAVPPACSAITMAIMGLSLSTFWGNGYQFRDLPNILFPQTAASTVKA